MDLRYFQYLVNVNDYYMARGQKCFCTQFKWTIYIYLIYYMFEVKSDYVSE